MHETTTRVSWKLNKKMHEIAIPRVSWNCSLFNPVPVA